MTTQSTAIPIASRSAVSTRSPALAVFGGFAAGAVLAVALLLGPGAGGSEPMVSGSVLLAFGLGWGLMAWLSTRYSTQPQRWMVVPATFLGSIGLVLIALQPNSTAMDLLSWVWPPVLAGLAIWMLVQVRRQLRGRGRWLVVPLIAMLLVFSIGGAGATVGAAVAPTAAAATGRLIDVGGHRLYIECAGSGGPAVVLQSGLAETSAYWSKIASSVAASTTVCVYDRAGHGRSDATAPQDGIALATDLRTLLERAGLAGPYLLVAHSSGGVYLRVFASMYADDVAGMVLLDAQPADAFTALPDYPGDYQSLRLIYGLGPSLARIGLLGPGLGLPSDESTVAAARAAHDELGILPAALQQAQGLTSLGSRPLIVVTALSGATTGWSVAQDRMVELSTNAAHVVLPTATHTSIITGDDRAASVQAILDVLAAIRTATPLR